MSGAPRIVLPVLAAALLPCLGGSSAQSAPAVVPPEIAPHVPRNLETYFVVFLVDPGPASRAPMPRDLFVRHQAHLRSQVEAGILRLAGPFTDGGRIRGIEIVSANSLEEARAIADADPAVQAGVMAVEIHPAILPSLAGLRIEYPPAAR